MKTETLGWIVFLPLAVIAALLYSSLPRGVILICLVVVVMLVVRLMIGTRR